MNKFPRETIIMTKKSHTSMPATTILPGEGALPDGCLGDSFARKRERERDRD